MNKKIVVLIVLFAHARLFSMQQQQSVLSLIEIAKNSYRISPLFDASVKAIEEKLSGIGQSASNIDAIYEIISRSFHSNDSNEKHIEIPTIENDNDIIVLCEKSSIIDSAIKNCIEKVSAQILSGKNYNFPSGGSGTFRNYCMRKACEAVTIDNKVHLVLDNYKADWTKILVALSPNGDIYTLSMPVWGPNNWSSQHHFVSKKIVSCLKATENYGSTEIFNASYYVGHELYKNEDFYYNEPVWEGTSDNRKESWLKESQLTNRCDSFADGSLVITHVWGGFEIYDVVAKNRTHVRKQYITDNSISTLSCSPNTKNIAIGSYDGTITIYSVLDTPQIEKNQKGRSFNKYYDFRDVQYAVETLFAFKHPVAIKDMCYLPDGKNIVFCSGENVYMVSCEAMKQEDVIPTLLYTGQASIECVDVGYNAKKRCSFVVCGSSTGCITKITIDKDKKCINFVGGPQSIVHSINIASDGKAIVAGFHDGSVCVWDISDEQPPVLLQHLKHNDPVYFVKFSTDRKKIVVKITKTSPKGYNHTDEVFIYSTSNNLVAHMATIKEQVEQLQVVYARNIHDPIALYTILAKNEQLFVNNKQTTIVDMRKRIEGRIKELLKDENIHEYVEALTSLTALEEFLLSLPGSFFIHKTKHIGLSGMGGSKSLKDPFLEDLREYIEKQQAKIGDLVIKELLIQNTYQMQLEALKNNDNQELQSIKAFVTYYNFVFKWLILVKGPNGLPLSYYDRLFPEDNAPNAHNNVLNGIFSDAYNHIASNPALHVGVIAATTIGLGWLCHWYKTDK